jgi:transcriptional regulator with XRE-family HTH domain
MNGNEVRTLRTNLGLNPQHLATLLGVHLTTVYRWEAQGAQELRLEPLQHGLLLQMQKRLAQNPPKDFGQQLLEGLLIGGTLVGLALLLADLTEPTKRRSKR